MLKPRNRRSLSEYVYGFAVVCLGMPEMLRSETISGERLRTSLAEGRSMMGWALVGDSHKRSSRRMDRWLR